MLPRPCPAEAYRRVEIDAYIVGGEAAQLTRLCLAETIGALNRALYFDSRSEAEQRSACLAKASASIQALKLGVDRKQPLAEALLIVYGNAIGRLSRNMREFDARAISALRQDFLDIEQAFAEALV
jgi:flagellin-specific chaperone FliS